MKIHTYERRLNFMAQGVPIMPNMLHFGALFSYIPISRRSITSLFSPLSLPLPSPPTSLQIALIRSRRRLTSYSK